MIFTIVVGISLIGSYAMWAVPAGQDGSNGLAPGTLEGFKRYQELQTMIRDYSQALKANPDNIAMWLELANAQYDVGVQNINAGNSPGAVAYFSDAVKSYEKVLEKQPDNVDARVDMATAAFYAGLKEIARDNFEKAIAANPNHLNARYNYGIFLVTAETEYQAAVAQWEAALALDPPKDMANNLRQWISEYKGK